LGSLIKTALNGATVASSVVATLAAAGVALIGAATAVTLTVVVALDDTGVPLVGLVWTSTTLSVVLSTVPGGCPLAAGVNTAPCSAAVAAAGVLPALPTV
jgi:hypothetical protein